MPSFWQTLRVRLLPAAGLVAGLALCIGAPSMAQAAPAGPEEARYKAATLLLDDLRSVPEFELGAEQYLLVIQSFRKVYETAPGCSYCDASLLAIGNLYREMAYRLSRQEYRGEALKSYQLLLKEFPGSALRAEAEKAMREIGGGPLAPPPPATPRRDETPATKELADIESGDSVAGEEAGIEVSQAMAAAGSLAGRVAEDSPSPVVPISMGGNEAATDGKPARIREIRFWTHPDYSRVIVELDKRVVYSRDEIPDPPRMYIDLLNALLPEDKRTGWVVEVGDAVLQRIRTGQNTRENARVVFDLAIERPYYSVTWLANPPRLVVEMRAEAPLVLTEAGEEKPAAAQALVRAAGSETTPSTPSDAGGSLAAKPAPARFTGVASAAIRAPQPRAVDRAEALNVKLEAPSSSSEVGRTEIAKVNPPPVDLPLPKPADTTSSGHRNLIRALGLKVGRVVIDAGHGGHDTGSIGPGGLREKDLVLDVALRLGKLIEKGLGSEVVHTRTDDTFVDLDERTRVANDIGADLFISVHANSFRDEAVRGVETYYLNFSTDSWAMNVASRENATSQRSVHELQDLVSKIALKENIDESREFAAKVQDAMHNGLSQEVKGLRNRGVRRAPLVVLIGAKMPSILAEVGFLSNKQDEKLLKSSAFREKVAQYLYDGVAAYAETLSHISVAQK